MSSSPLESPSAPADTALQKPSPRLTPPARARARLLGRAILRSAGTLSVRTAGHLTWRARHPADRDRFAEAPPAPLATAAWYATEDGVRAPLPIVPARPGGAGEPVLLAHALGVGADGFRLGSDGTGRGADATLAGALAERGFRVYLLTHRGDRAALAPAGVPLDFDAILERDLPAALERVRADSGYPRVHLVGHGLGGQLALAWGARDGDVATVTAIAAPVAFRRGWSAAAAAHLLPAGWPVPVRWLARLAAPFLGPDELGGALTTGASPGSRVRGAAHHSAEDLPLGLVRQLESWTRTGAWTSRGGVVDWLETLAGARCPLHVVHGVEDRVCPPTSAVGALERWGGADRTALAVDGYGHLDAILGQDAPGRVFAPVADWLDARRRLAWGDGFR